MFVYYINVPLNNAGQHELDSYADQMPNVYTTELCEEEYDSLRKKGGLFEQFDSHFNMLIDVCEEERLELTDIPAAKRITERYLRKSDSPIELQGCRKVLESLQQAEASHTYWEIDIYIRS